VAAWRVDCNERRAHSTLGYRTPAEHAAEWRARQCDGDERSSEVLRQFTNPDSTNLAVALKLGAGHGNEQLEAKTRK
jgi:hypothetical protein